MNNSVKRTYILSEENRKLSVFRKVLMFVMHLLPSEALLKAICFDSNDVLKSNLFTKKNVFTHLMERVDNFPEIQHYSRNKLRSTEKIRWKLRVHKVWNHFCSCFPKNTRHIQDTSRNNIETLERLIIRRWCQTAVWKDTQHFPLVDTETWRTFKHLLILSNWIIYLRKAFRQIVKLR